MGGRTVKHMEHGSNVDVYHRWKGLNGDGFGGERKCREVKKRVNRKEPSNMMIIV